MEVFGILHLYVLSAIMLLAEALNLTHLYCSDFQWRRCRDILQLCIFFASMLLGKFSNFTYLYRTELRKIKSEIKTKIKTDLKILFLRNCLVR